MTSCTLSLGAFASAAMTLATALSAVPGSKACSNPPCWSYDLQAIDGGGNGIRAVDLSDGEFHTFKLRWDPGAAHVAFYIDGVRQWEESNFGKGTFGGKRVIPQFGFLNLGVWFPDSWSGSPDFDECEALVDYVNVTAL